MSPNEHEGWTNPATRNIYLNIDNDDAVNAVKGDLLRLIHRPVSELDVRRFVRDYLGSIHSDLLADKGDTGCRFEDINWQELADAWEAERHDLKA